MPSDDAPPIMSYEDSLKFLDEVKALTGEVNDAVVGICRWREKSSSLMYSAEELAEWEMFPVEFPVETFEQMLEILSKYVSIDRYVYFDREFGKWKKVIDLLKQSGYNQLKSTMKGE